ncbi:Alkylated DNA nucleotide flippase Atl1, participates in nucleotide excision repair, Ada-like DNA-binding domain [Chitinophaga costaii]|uniref:Alkylated DNA nucleotide flippase Atl1, participates in nucleotide excision repair, Ada-like DNA-binding domain n=2 Tax=Chitinophaga costaii TaxID=1335309 RepID=A0A1C4FQY6_9BACT|nr:Alkylated DNA nucleotide flippase Atl1, participates in nucleotide excision repair, Ada-like DNA-binding domain [Chitinophaga costaii]
MKMVKHKMSAMAVMKTSSANRPPSHPGNGATKTGATTSKESFFTEVFRLVRQVPKGRVTSYGDIANGAQARITARMVGWAMHAAGTAKPPVPAHRVVNSSGVLSGKQAFPTPTLMEELLAQEGVTVKNNKVQHFAKIRWAPPPAKNKAMPVIKHLK